MVYCCIVIYPWVVREGEGRGKGRERKGKGGLQYITRVKIDEKEERRRVEGGRNGEKGVGKEEKLKGNMELKEEVGKGGRKEKGVR